MTDIDRSNSLADLAHQINAEHEAAESAQRKTLQHAIAAGKLLIEAKEGGQLKHGQWLPWLENHCRIPERTAQHYMRLAKHESEIRSVADLSQRAAIAAISEIAPDEHEAVLAEGKRLADNVREAHAAVLKEIERGLKERRAFAEGIYSLPEAERNALIKHLDQSEETGWTVTKSGKRRYVHWVRLLNFWRTIDDETIAYAQFKMSQESGMLP
jgi:hypothetical protein